MITFSKLGSMGRLGNQLWQLASCIGIATKHSHEYSFPEWEYQKYFKNQLPVSKINYADVTYVQQEASFSYQEFNIPQEGLIDINGYLQSWKYFQHCENLIRKQFEFKNPIDIDLSNTVSIHVRRTDYLSVPDYHYNLPLPYYYKAMKWAFSMNDNFKFLVFSDDIEWCKKQSWGKYNVSFSEGKSEIEDFHLMSKCAVNIISNSSFSWWASWLNPNPYKVTVVPEKYYWFGKNGRHNDVSDLYLPSWKIINL